MQISIFDLKAKMTALLKAKGYANTDIPFLIDMYLGGELRGHTSHGLASFPGFVSEDYSSLEQPAVLQETEAFFLIDANGNPGTLVGKRAADEAIARAKKQVVGFAMIKNMDSWLRPGAIAEYIANQDLLTVVANSGGGVAIAPPGGFDAVAGTNPIAYGIPTNDGALVVDMATAKRAWGQVRLANKYGTELPADTFYNDQGEVTLDPKQAYSVKAFGDYKGFALAFLIEVMCGSLLGMDMMVEDGGSGSQFGQKMPERGAFILVVDPSKTTDLTTFKQDNSEYIKKIKTSRPIHSQTVRIPGDEASHKAAEHYKTGTIELPDELWVEIQSIKV